MKRRNLFGITGLISTLLVAVLFAASCNEQTKPDPSASEIIGSWTFDEMGDFNDLIETTLTFNEDGTLFVNSFSSIDEPDEPDTAIPMKWKVEGENLIFGFPGIEQEDEIEEADYEYCKFKVEDDYLALCADDFWYFFHKIN